MNILGISCFFHDAAAALVQDGIVTAAAEEERFSRIKSLLRERMEILWLKAFPSFDWTHQQMIYEGGTSPYLEQAYRDVAASLEEFRSLAKVHHFVPILVVFPLPGQARRPDALTHMQHRMEAIAQQLGLPAIDLLPTLRQAYAAERDVYIPWDNTHLSPRGHRAVAAILERYLLDNHLLPPEAGRSREPLTPPS